MLSRSNPIPLWVGLLVIVMVTVTNSSPSKRGFCLSLCGSVNNVQCPFGYECKSNGCGHQCYKITFEQPEGCPDNSECKISCPLGYKRDQQGCEFCDCDYSPLQQGAVGSIELRSFFSVAV